MTLEVFKRIREELQKSDMPMVIPWKMAHADLSLLLPAAERSITLEAENAKLKAQLRIMREALEFYASHCAVEDFIRDGRGDAARQALEELK